jgi:hypothetical protein
VWWGLGSQMVKEEYRILGYDPMYCGTSLSQFWRNALSLSPGSKSKPSRQARDSIVAYMGYVASK